MELRQAQANLVLAPQITHYRSEYLDKVIEMQAKAGILDKGLIRGYLESDFARLDVSAYPPLLMSEKTTLDEGFHALNGNGEAACQLAESVWNLDQESPFLSPIRRVMLMVRLNEYYVAFGNREKGRELIAQFSAFAPEAPQNRMTYLLRFLVVMLEWASENAGSEFLETAQGVFERNEEFILALPVSGNRSLVLITMMVAYLGKLEVARAKQLFDHLYREKDQKPPLLYRISGLICHLMILFEAREIAELKHHAKNHRELMLEKGEFSIPAIHLLGFLQKNARRYATPKATPKVVHAYRTDLEKIIQLLEGFQELEGFRRGDRGAIRLFYEPFLQWLRAKRI
ncbi:MAG: hypothetical protein U0176_24735 [Bacteroidia bacterium]